MNLREIARRVNKNPGSISSVMKKLLERGLVTDCRVGKVSVAYRLNYESKRVQALMALRKSMSKTSE